MVVSVAVYEIFSVKEWCDLENGVRVCSRSLEMAPFDRSLTSSYSPSIVTIGLGCTVEIWYFSLLMFFKCVGPLRRDRIDTGEINKRQSV